jgi:hypothetical protein
MKLALIADNKKKLSQVAAAREFSISGATLQRKLKDEYFQPTHAAGGHSSLPISAEVGKQGFAFTKYEIKLFIKSFVVVHITKGSEFVEYLRKHCKLQY